MNDRLTEAQMAQVVAEVERLSQRREAEYNPEQVKQILQELNLPPELLEDAMVQLRRQEALAEQKRRNRWIMGGVVVALMGAIATTAVYVQNQNRVENAIANVSAANSLVTLTQNGGSSANQITRQSNPRVYYRVTLQNAPIGQKLSLACDWIDPSGNIAHQSRYQTRQIDKSVWPTYCYHQLNSGSAAGTWKVQMLLGNRTVSTSTFNVK
ncbi:DUF3859 domain-containing protein [Microseira wollei]|uniref:DUF3859 domain-containing protein n=1 Tax=Microseira wollei NIES-4236 TaxID=2530354 RepID=A0AAV3XB63_9CYAN|nr:DUF3859 domain-containing protein [Microseira wollei]GET38611.1 hypothetical protein MiSe_33690 [Microseira wollei NIES-4236]